MKSKVTMTALSVAVFVAAIFGVNSEQKVQAADGKILYYSCSMHPSVKSDKPGSCPRCGMELMPVYGNDSTAGNAGSSTDTNSPASEKPTPYPLKTCVVSGEKLGGDMGEPVVFIYQTNGINQEIKFCCSMCKPKFLKDPDKYMKVIKAAEAKK